MRDPYPTAALVGRFYAERNREYPLSAPVISVGSARESTLRIPNARVAPSHVHIRRDRSVYSVHAVTGAAATSLNGRTLSPGECRGLAHGDVLSLSDLEFEFVQAPVGRPRARLRVLGGVHRGKLFRIEGARAALGRALDNDIQFPDLSVSRHHCRVWRDGVGWLIEDVGSTNGTMVNGALLTAPARLRDGDQVLAGFSRFLFRTAIALALLLTPAAATSSSAAASAATASPAAQSPSQAAYIADRSFQLPPSGQPGAPDGASAIASGPEDRVYIADERGGVFVYDATGIYVRTFGQSHLKRPAALAVTLSGEAFVLDADARQVVVFGPGGQLLRRFAGRGRRPGELDRPVDLALGPAGYVHVLDAGRRSVHIFSRDGVFIREIDLEIAVRDPLALAVGNDGSMYIADDAATGWIVALPHFSRIPWGGGLARGVPARLAFPGATLEEPGAVVVNHFGLAFTLDGKSGRVWATAREGDGSIAAARDGPLYGGTGSGRGSFREAVDLAIAGPNELLILDRRLRKVERVRWTGTVERAARPDLDFPIRVTRSDLTLPAPLHAIGYGADRTAPRFVLDVRGRAVTVLGSRPQPRTTAYGDSIPEFVPDAAVFQVHLSEGLDRIGRAASGAGRIAVTDPGKDRFVVFRASDGTVVGAFGHNYRDERRLDDPHGVAVLADGRIAVADTRSERIKIFSADLASLSASVPFRGAHGLTAAPNGDLAVWNRDGTAAARLPRDGNRPVPIRRDLLPDRIADMSFDAAGNLFVLDAAAGRITVLDPGLDRILIRFGAEGDFDRAQRVAVDRSGNVYIAEGGAERTRVYRWDIAVPPLAGFATEYREGAALLRWPASENPYIGSYLVEGAQDAGGPYTEVGRTDAPEFRFQPDGGTILPRYVRVRPVAITGVPGPAVEPRPLLHLTARAALERGDLEGALRDAREGTGLLERGVLGGDPEVETELRWVAFLAASRLDRHADAVRQGRGLAGSLADDRKPDLFLRLTRAHLALRDPSGAAQQLLSLIAHAPHPHVYRDTAVIRASFQIYRDLRRAGAAREGLAFLRQYTRTMPAGVETLRLTYTDSIDVFDTRERLGPGFEHWRNANYAEVIRFFREMLQTAELSPRQRIVCHQMMAAAYYAFGRKHDAASEFREIFRYDPHFHLATEISRLQRLYALTSLYNHETRQFFSALRPRS